MPNFDYDGIICLPNDRVAQLQLLHGCEGGVQTLANIFVGWIREFVDEPHYRAVAGEPFLQNVILCDMGRQSTWTLYLDSVVEDPYMNIISYPIVPMKDGVSNNLMQSLKRVLNRL